MSKGVKIVTIGGGSSYTPELMEGFIKRHAELPVKELWLVDIEEGREKLEIVGKLAQRMVKAAGIDCTVHLTLDRREALKDADFVTTQFRVGLLDARVKDERIPLKYGMIGQETNGAGGIFKALRTIPVILDIVEDMKELCPNAWLVNFTNPAGMVTEAVSRIGKWDRVVGLCNVPIMCEMIAEFALNGGEGGMMAFFKEKEKFSINMDKDLFFRFGGINHLHWHRIFDQHGEERTMEVLDKIYGASEAESGVANINPMKFPYEQIKDLGMMPCPYHQYYYTTGEALERELADVESGKGTRAEQVKKVEAELFEIYKNADLHEKPAQLSMRGGAFYSDAACEVINSIYNNKGTIMVVSTKNNGTMPDLHPDSVIEVSAYITAAGPQPIQFGHLPPSARGLLQQMKAMEELTIEAAITGDYGKALQAFTANPIITSGQKAKDLLDEMLEAHKEHLPLFHK
ncbi:MAG: 6-phospho-beta-glucosidase [Turicibacter sp.]|nr:6-phospho-beta-glucosidase [Turicibacter sp.]